MRRALFILLFIVTPLRLVAFETTLIDNDSTFDVTYVRLELTVSPTSDTIAGAVTIRSVARILASDNRIQLSLRDSLSVDSVSNAGLSTSFEHTGDFLFITLGLHYSVGETFDVTVFYHGSSHVGDPVHSTQIWDSIERLTHTNYPINWSVSEPFASQNWWPCKDNPADKIDSADLYFTCPKQYSVASNGTLGSVVEHDRSHTYWWHESYPIDHYLIAFVCTTFDTLTHWHHWADGDSTRIVHYVFPGSADTMLRSYIVVDSILDLYERWFGPYPFRKEKYGIAQWHGGGMENETLSFCNDADSALLAHETAHQWFGDAITCKTWNDCWLNEGFATYVADLFDQHNHGQEWLDTIIARTERSVTSQPGGSVHIPDSLLLHHALDGRLVYDKAALVLHMLRFVLGSDTAFFRAVREYITGPLRYGVASAEDFRAAIERASGQDLKWFFDEWIYGDGYPIYNVSWAAKDSLHPAVAISQTGSTPISPFFTMPIELEFSGDGIDTIVQVWHDQPLKAYQFSFPKGIRQLIFDPHNWLLDGSMSRTLGVEVSASTSSEFTIHKLLNSYAIDFSIVQPGEITVEIYDLLGRLLVTVPEGMLDAGSHSIVWQPEGLAASVYFCRLISKGQAIAIKHFIVTN